MTNFGAKKGLPAFGAAAFPQNGMCAISG